MFVLQDIVFASLGWGKDTRTGQEAKDPPGPCFSSRSSEHKNAYENVLEEEEGRVRNTHM